MDGENILDLEPDERARKGLFLAFQYPSEIPGVTIANFLRAALQARLPEGEELEATDYYARLYEKMDLLEMDRSFTSRSVNEGFSGGEKKRNEILQMAMLEPKYAVLDETDSGLDIDALKIVAARRQFACAARTSAFSSSRTTSACSITSCPITSTSWSHGRIVRSGGKELALELEEKGYDWVTTRTIARAGAGLTERTIMVKLKLSPFDIDRNVGNFSYPETHTLRRRHRPDREDRSTTSPT